ncbi:MAG: MraZ N-terminal domain-containing protein [Cyanobium sp. MAG06]|nr:MraZ N-terminal domain-containing protein [Cyanobium sp. MAG06]
MFIGSYTHNIDDKNRISIPKKWVSVLGNTVILTTGLDGSIFLYNKKD